jgi:hypothetical protein
VSTAFTPLQGKAFIAVGPRTTDRPKSAPGGARICIVDTVAGTTQVFNVDDTPFQNFLQGEPSPEYQFVQPDQGMHDAGMRMIVAGEWVHIPAYVPHQVGSMTPRICIAVYSSECFQK